MSDQLLNLAIWVPLFFGVLTLATGSDRNAQAARVIALIGAVLGFAVTLPLYTGFDPKASGFQFVYSKPQIAAIEIRGGTRIRNRSRSRATTTSASTASRCCSSC